MNKNPPISSHISEEIQNFLQKFILVQESLLPFSIPERRKKFHQFFADPSMEDVNKVENVNIRGRNGEIPLRIIIPANRHDNAVIIYLHGGGWVYGSNSSSENLCRKIANRLHSPVVQVDYRLAPENKFPIPLEDCVDAVKWASGQFGKNRLIVCGESAGGNLAAATALKMLDEGNPEMTDLVLINPVLTSDLNKEDYENSLDKQFSTYSAMEWFWKQYLKNMEEGNNPYASPLKAEINERFPRTMILTAEYDALRFEGKAFAEKLNRAGVAVIHKEYPKVIHGFIGLPIPSKEIEHAFHDINAFLFGNKKGALIKDKGTYASG